MSQPPAYNRAVSFTNLQALNPTGQPPGASMDVEYNAIKTTLDAIRTNLARLQRDDGALANGSVGLAQLSTAVTIGFSVPSAWATATSYVSSPASTVFNGGKFYSCLVSHTSGTFATDLAALKWVLIADLTAIPITTAAQVSVTASGLLTTDVQGSLQALDTGKAATSHTHPASAISDSTVAGRAFLLAADVTAQNTLLGLGALAFLNSVPITAVAAQFAYTGVISPAALSGNTNDWAPTGYATATRVRFSMTSAFNITGLAATSDGDIKILDNIGATNSATVVSQSASSAAANRFAMAYPVIIKPLESRAFMYDGTTARWRLIGRNRTEPKVPNIQTFLSGTTQTYTTATNSNSELPVRIRVRMVAGGGGGGAQATNNGAAGGDSSWAISGFTTWTAIHGNGGLNGNGGVVQAGGTGGTGGADGTGTKVNRINGQTGQGTFAVVGTGGAGGGTVFGPGAPGQYANAAGTNAVANTGTGGSGASNSGSVIGSGGGGGEYVEFELTGAQILSTYTYSVGTAGAGGAAGTTAGGNGAAGRIEVEAFWQ